MIDALGGLAHHLADQYELQRLGHPYYNSRAGGGEGHLEVAKNIYYSNKDLAHMVLSVKPFGCMPSTQSDGAQAAVVSHYRDIIYLPIETSGEGEINAHSRVQMALGEAKAKAKREFAETLEKTGLTLKECYEYVEAHPGTEASHVQGTAHQGRGRRSGELRDPHRGPHEEGRRSTEAQRRSGAGAIAVYWDLLTVLESRSHRAGDTHCRSSFGPCW